MDPVGEFLEWLEQRGYTICETDYGDQQDYISADADQVLAEWREQRTVARN